MAESVCPVDESTKNYTLEGWMVELDNVTMKNMHDHRLID